MPPRRAQRKETTPEPEPEQPALTPNHHFLRTNVKWAAVCQYIITFFPAIGIPEFTVQALEDDLANSTFTIIPKLMHKMLYTTTLDRRINSETWEIYLRKQLVKRDSEMNPMGDDDEPIDWVDLSVESKLDVFSRIIEWPFYNPTRLRQQMNDDDNFARWRAEPIGHDQQRNAYWFIGGERLWIQRSKEPPRVRKPKPKPKKKTATPKADALPKRRGRPPKAKPSLATESASASRDSSSGPRRRSKRASVIEASTRPAKRRRMLGTRISSRLHRNEELDEEWQQIPEEWMPKSDEDSSYSEGESKMAESKASRSSKRLNPVETDDNDSDLTELSDEAASKSDDAEDAEKEEGSDAEESDEGTKEADGEDEEVKEEGKEETDAAKQEKAPATTWMSPDDPNWVEWETICITLEEWKEFVVKFKGSNSTYERQLYRRLTKEFLPYVEEVFEERQRIAEEKRMQELKVHQEVESYVGRKRSTRLAIIESTKEKQREEDAAKAEEDAKHDRARRVEAREHKQVSEREKRELEREKRRQERELQELLEAQKAAEDEEKEKVTSAKLAAMQEARGTSGANRPIRKSRAAISYTQSPNGTPPPAERESWELACEICGKKGWNIDDGKVISACERCGKWQHTECHDKADDQAGRPRRDWSKVEFLCKSCQKRKPRKSAAEGNKAKAKPATNGNPIQLQTAPPPVPQIHPHPPYHPYTNGHYAPPPPQPYPQPPQGVDPNNIRGMQAYVPQPTAPAYGSQYLHSYPSTQAAPYSHQASPYGVAARPLPHANGSSQSGAVPYGQQPVYPQYPPVQGYRPPPPHNPYPSQPHGQAPTYWPGQGYPYPQVPHVPNGVQGQGYPGATPQPGQPDKQSYGHGAFDAAQLLAMQAHRAPPTQLAPPPPPSAPMPVSVAIPAHVGANGYAGPTA